MCAPRSLVLGLAALAACTIPRRPLPTRFEFAQAHMGTLFRVVLYASDPVRAESAAAEAWTEIAKLDRLLSDFAPGSEVSLLSTEPRRVSPETVEVLLAARRYAELSGGAFDPTVGPVVALWRRARKDGRLPTAEERRDALSLVGWWDVAIDETRSTVRLARPGMKVDLGAIGKGYAADRALAVLRTHGIPRALVDAGGDLALGDPPPGEKGWRIAVDGEDGALVLSNGGVATSGDTERFVETGGVRYSHIVDPRTGLGLTAVTHATVVAPDATSADALATAVSVLGPAAGLRLVASLPGANALVRSRADGEERRQSTPGFARLLEQRSAERGPLSSSAPALPRREP